LFAGQCFVDTTGSKRKLENGILKEIVETYLHCSSDWFRSISAPLIRTWGYTRSGNIVRQTLLSLLQTPQNLPSADGWVKEIAIRCQQILANANELTGRAKLRLHIMMLLYQLQEKDNIHAWIQEARDDLASEKFSDANLRATAAITLGTLCREQTQQVKDALLAALSDSAWQVRSAAARALGILANIDPAILSDLYQRLQHISDDKKTREQEKETVIIALGQMSHVKSNAHGILEAILTQLLKDLPTDSNNMYNPSIKRTSVLTVGQIVLKQSDENIAAMSSSAGMPGFLLQAIHDEDSSVRQAAAIALGCLGKKTYWKKHQDIIEALLVAHTDVYLPVIETASRALENFGKFPRPIEEEPSLSSRIYLAF